MKRFFFVATLALTANLLQAQDVNIKSESRPNTDFAPYKTYAWASQIESGKAGAYFMNNTTLRNQIRDAVGYAMDGRGYQLKRQNPDLLVNFRVFDQPTTIKGYTNAGTDYFGPGEVQTLGDEQDIQLQAGSILVNIVDAKTDQVVWTGLASGLTSPNGFEKQQSKIREAINLIFNQYSYRADKY